MDSQDISKQEDINAEENTGVNEPVYDPEKFIGKVVAFADTHKSRILGIIKNVDESGIFIKESKQELLDFNEIIRSLEIDGIQQLERLENYHKELTSYPRTLTFYQAKMDNLQKRIFEQIAADKDQAMRFIFFYEMSINIKRIYTNLKKDVMQIDEFTVDKNLDDRPNATKFQKQSFLDARTSIENTLSDIDEILKENIELFDHASNADNFKQA
jgi:hypothetical protein